VAEATTPRSRNIVMATLERLMYSAPNYWLVLVSDVLGAVVFLIVGIRRFTGSLVVAGVSVIVGFVAWGLIEYVFHRSVLHGRPSIARRAHALHHADGTTLISTPAFVIMGGAFITWALLATVFSSGVACLLVFGLYAGYNYYALLHHLEHYQGTLIARVAALARLERVHRIHHARHVVNYGVSTTIWDRLFGTFQSSNEPNKRRR
jgi:sterol desaturase/sphingolipid hydroxylase (fatty acid hydroxylase superfamily)